jgi:hypothetical protein
LSCSGSLKVWASNQSPVIGVEGAGCPVRATGVARKPTHTSPSMTANTLAKKLFPRTGGVVTISDSFADKDLSIRFF